MFQRKVLEPRSFETDASGPSLEAVEEAPQRRVYGNRQHQLMLGSLVLLLVALGLLIYNDRDFWFPDTLEADDTLPGVAAAGPSTTGSSTAALAHGAPASAVDGGHSAKKRSGSTAQTKDSTPASDPPAAVPPVTEVRTVLPPLQVEVVAGNVHNTVHPGTNSVRVDLQPGSPAQNISDPAPPAEADTAAGVTSSVAENVRMSRTPEMVSRSVAPNYPLLARQMKVQGSVILQALINRDGTIQDLRIVSGPPILASAAREAVRQWHFKPRYQGNETVETLARITVNFTISTN
jgi:TonB family protein